MTQRFAFLFFAAFAACTHARRDIRAFYFPIENLAEGRVYDYAPVGTDTIPPDYWYFRALSQDGAQYLLATYYDGNFEVGQLTLEKFTASGARAEDYFLYVPDSAGQRSIRIDTKLESPDVFPFSVQDSAGVFLFSLNFHPPGDSATTIYLIRNRRYLGDGPDFEFKGKKHPTIRFSLREAVGNSAEGDAEVESRGEEWYAKGLGLVYYRKVTGTSGKMRQEFRLRDTFSMRELERRAGQELGRF